MARGACVRAVFRGTGELGWLCVTSPARGPDGCGPRARARPAGAAPREPAWIAADRAGVAPRPGDGPTAGRDRVDCPPEEAARPLLGGSEPRPAPTPPARAPIASSAARPVAGAARAAETVAAAPARRSPPALAAAEAWPPSAISSFDSLGARGLDASGSRCPTGYWASVCVAIEPLLSWLCSACAKRRRAAEARSLRVLVMSGSPDGCPGRPRRPPWPLPPAGPQRGRRMPGQPSRIRLARGPSAPAYRGGRRPKPLPDLFTFVSSWA